MKVPTLVQRCCCSFVVVVVAWVVWLLWRGWWCCSFVVVVVVLWLLWRGRCGCGGRVSVLHECVVGRMICVVVGGWVVIFCYGLVNDSCICVVDE